MVAAGVLFAAALCHQLDAAQQSLAELSAAHGGFPWANFVCGCAFTLFLLLEEAVASFTRAFRPISAPPRELFNFKILIGQLGARNFVIDHSTTCMPGLEAASTKEAGTPAANAPAATAPVAAKPNVARNYLAIVIRCFAVLGVISMAYHIRCVAAPVQRSHEALSVSHPHSRRPLNAPLSRAPRLLLSPSRARRLYAINTYGRVIHEFDPWFNFRATKYLADNGWYEFFHWFDHKSWYPLGRPVGTTIYPGMQITAVALWNALKHAPAWLITLLQTGTAHGRDGLHAVLDLTDVCCFMPAWFGAITSLFVGLLTREASNSDNVGIIAAAIMAIIPAHIMRSVGGGFDNESVALTAMCSTFFFWVRSLRHRDVTKKSWLWGIVTGLAYINMVAAWGGYIFVLNMVAVHAAATVAIGRYSQTLHRAYSLFFIIGTFGAVQIPVVGWVPFKSLEQLSAVAVFVVLNVMEVRGSFLLFAALFSFLFLYSF